MKVKLDETRITRKKLDELIREEVNRQGAEICKISAENQTVEVVATFMYLFYEQHWHKDRVQKYFDMICEIYERPAVFGKTIKGRDVVKFVSEKYDLDFSKLKPKFEVEIST